MRWLATCVFLVFNYAGWLTPVLHDGWLGVWFPETLARWQCRAGIFFPGELNINEDWRGNILLVVTTLFEQFSQKWSLGTPVLTPSIYWANRMNASAIRNLLNEWYLKILSKQPEPLGARRVQVERIFKYHEKCISILNCSSFYMPTSHLFSQKRGL